MMGNTPISSALKMSSAPSPHRSSLRSFVSHLIVIDWELIRTHKRHLKLLNDLGVTGMPRTLFVSWVLQFGLTPRFIRINKTNRPPFWPNRPRLRGSIRNPRILSQNPRISIHPTPNCPEFWNKGGGSIRKGSISFIYPDTWLLNLLIWTAWNICCTKLFVSRIQDFRCRHFAPIATQILQL